ncbi:MAG: methyltransferase, TrmH family, group 3 [Gammaproteobacteria bacterium]|jgi:23S rRNA (guanosine2251-2'-O)-methyltransferase|nr:methyltransferase, TrmH family, group 3 [Gammaproteobacteria bacterium]
MSARNRYIYGIHAAQAVCSSRPSDIQCIYTLHGRNDTSLQAITELAARHHIPLKRLDRQALTDLIGDQHHQGVIIECKPNPSFSLPNDEKALFSYLETLTKPPFLLILDGVQDPHNLGACLRTADAAGVNAVIAPKDKAASITPIVRKIACGATESVPFVSVVNLARTMAQLKEKGVWIYGACAQADKSLYALNFKGAVALVLGAEGTGLRDLTRKHCDAFFKIPMHGQVESLNVSVAAGVCLFEALRQR